MWQLRVARSILQFKFWSNLEVKQWSNLGQSCEGRAVHVAVADVAADDALELQMSWRMTRSFDHEFDPMVK